MPASGLEVRLRQSAPIPLEVELACAPQELLALVGPSGSGKSTILRAIAGVSHAAEGRISCGGRCWFDSAAGVVLNARERRVGFVFQHYGLFPHLTALGNVAESMVDLPRVDRAARARDLLARVHLDGFESRYPAELSGGQQQRVAVARALAREPNVLLLDEPFAAVDRGTRERLYTELVELRRELSIPVVLVTHDLDEAAMLADRMTVLHLGRTLQTGTPYEVVTAPRSAHVAQLVGIKNVFRAGVIEHRPETGETLIEWRKHVLRAPLQAAHAAGAQVTWAISQGQLVLAGRGEVRGDNHVAGTVVRLVRLGANAAVAVAIGGADRPPLHMSVPLHVAHEHGLEPGADVTVAVLARGIHLMPADEGAETAGRPHRRMQPASEVLA